MTVLFALTKAAHAAHRAPSFALVSAQDVTYRPSSIPALFSRLDTCLNPQETKNEMVPGMNREWYRKECSRNLRGAPPPVGRRT